MNKPLFSILIAQYNNGKYFEDCYKSIIVQTYQNWEVIIVDGCSTDDSVAVIKKSLVMIPGLKLKSFPKTKGVVLPKKDWQN